MMLHKIKDSLNKLNHHPTVVKAGKSLQFCHIVMLTVSRSGLHFYVGVALCVFIGLGLVETFAAKEAGELRETLSEVAEDELGEI